jgi:phosphate butyryltransferase
MDNAIPLPTFDNLHAWADTRRQPIVVAVVGGADRTVMQALHLAEGRGWVTPCYAGRRDELQRCAGEAGLTLRPGEVFDTDAPADTALLLVREGKAQLLMKGQISTPELLKAVLDPGNGFRTGRVIGQVVLMEIIPSQRQFLLVDTGICIQPTLEQKADLLASAVQVARKLGCIRSRVAVMAATEKVTEAMPETLDAVELESRSLGGVFGDCVVQGPLSFDVAYAADAGEKKRVPGQVVGAADVMLFPNLAAANLTVKAIMYTADCRFGGVLVGLPCPVVFMSRADSVATRLNSLALALRLLLDG